MKIRNKIAVSIIALAATGAPAVAATIVPAYQVTSVGNLTDTRPFTLGFEFALSSSQTVDALGYTTVGFTSDQQVGIWNSSGVLLTSVTVSTADTVVDNFAWASISNITLGPGTYTIGGTYSGGPFASNASGVTSISGYTYIADEQIQGTGLHDPNTSTGGYGTNGIPQVNFSVTSGVPEPATWAMFLVGFGGIGFTLRNSRRKGAIAAA